MSHKRTFHIDPKAGVYSLVVSTNFELIPGDSPHFRRPLREEGAEWQKLTKEQRALISLLKLEGVNKAKLAPYEAAYHVAIMVSRDDLVARLREVFVTVYGAKEVHIGKSTHELTPS